MPKSFTIFLDNLKNYVEVKTVCPEADIGLETPRSPVRLVDSKEQSPPSHQCHPHPSYILKLGVEGI